MSLWLLTVIVLGAGAGVGMGTVNAPPPPAIIVNCSSFRSCNTASSAFLNIENIRISFYLPIFLIVSKTLTTVPHRERRGHYALNDDIS